MQGDCAAPFKGGSDGPPVGDLAPRQCVLSLTARFVFLFNHAPGLWLDNLALRFTGTTEIGNLVDSTASTGLWLTGVAVAGGGLAPGVAVFGTTTLFASGVLPSCTCVAGGHCADSRPCKAVRCVTSTAVSGSLCTQVRIGGGSRRLLPASWQGKRRRGC